MQTSIVMFMFMCTMALFIFALFGACVFCCKLLAWLDKKYKLGAIAVLITVILMILIVNFFMTPVCYLIAGGLSW